MLTFIAVDLQLYKIFKTTRVSFFWDTVYNVLTQNISGPVAGLQPIVACPHASLLKIVN